MNPRVFLSPVTGVWVVLVAATLLTAWLAETRVGVHWVALAIVLIASVKIALIMSEFMEARTAPPVWRAVLGVWLAGVTVVVLSGHVS